MKQIIVFLLLIASFQFSFAQTDTLATETTVILVRHAEKLDDGSDDPKLNNTGVERAQKLANWITERYEVHKIYSTAYNRTKLTAGPISKVTDVPIYEYGFNDPVGLLSSIVEEYSGQTVLIVGHSNTTPMLANILLGKREYENLEEDVYDKIFVVKASEVGKGTAELFTY